MARMPRIEYYGAIYHIIHRGNNRKYIFENKDDKVYLLEILSDVNDIFDFYLLAYVIMDNHYHFLIKTHNIPISQIMHRINTRYAKYYNRKYERTGSPFEGRYRGIIVQDESYLIRLIKYIHNNPVYANISSSMDEYKWSSDIFYRMNLDNLVMINEVLDMFSPDRSRAIKKYQDIMSRVDEYEESKEEFEAVDIIGTDEFRQSINMGNERRKSLDHILKSVCPAQIDFKLIKKGSRKRYLTQFKREYIRKALEEGYSTAEIGDSLAISVSGVNNLYKK